VAPKEVEERKLVSNFFLLKLSLITFIVQSEFEGDPRNRGEWRTKLSAIFLYQMKNYYILSYDDP
jgi:hypothetical protein